MITACVPLGTQARWQQQRSAYAQPYGSQQQAPAYAQPANRNEDDDDYDDAAGGPSYGDANEPANERDRGHARGGEGGSTWTCVATGSIGTTQGNYPTIYSNKEWPDTGRTRDEAYLKALKGCNALIGNAANLGYRSGDAVEAGTGKVVNCRPTGT